MLWDSRRGKYEVPLCVESISAHSIDSVSSRKELHSIGEKNTALCNPRAMKISSHGRVTLAFRWQWCFNLSFSNTFLLASSSLCFRLKLFATHVSVAWHCLAVGSGPCRRMSRRCSSPKGNTHKKIVIEFFLLLVSSFFRPPLDLRKNILG